MTLTKSAKYFLLIAILVICVILSLISGRYPSPGFIKLFELPSDPIGSRIFYNLRVPRVILGILLGMTLGASGLIFQTVFNNPLVDSGMLGVTQGAAFGAALGIVFFESRAGVVQSFAIGFGLCGLILSVLSARKIHYGGWTLRLILAGSVVSAFFGAMLALLKVLADERNQLHAIEFWLMGGLGYTTWRGLPIVIVIVVCCLIVIWLLRWRVNLMSLNAETGTSLGVRVTLERLIILSVTVFAVAAVTSLSGIIGWAGLIVPHVARRVFSADTRDALPAAMLIGAILILICDNGSRTLTPIEIPLGVLIAFFGVIIFIVLMRKKVKK